MSFQNEPMGYTNYLFISQNRSLLSPSTQTQAASLFGEPTPIVIAIAQS